LYKFLERNKNLFVYGPLWFYWVILFIATTIPGKYQPDLGVSDKIEHFSAYMVLAVFLSLAYTFQTKFKGISNKPFLFTFLTIFGYGIIDETHQLFIPGRYCDWKDLTADVIGGLVGITFVYVIIRSSFFNNFDEAKE
jgi:VanZ family protein